MSSNSAVKILVAGASGYVGGRLVPLLLRKGYQVRCLARNPEKLHARDWPGVEIFAGDVLDPGSLKNALAGMAIAYYLVHSMASHQNFEDLDIQAATHFGNAAREAGIHSIIYLGGLAPKQQDLSPHLKSRQEVGNRLAKAGVPVTELRASIIIGSGSASFEIIRDLAGKLPIMITPRWVKSLCEPISIDDVLRYLTGCLTEPRTIGQTLEIGGGEIFSYGDMMKSVAQVMGKRILMLPVPVLTPRLSSYWLNLVTTVPMSIAYPLVEGLRNDSVCTDHRIRDWIPFTPVSFRQAVENSLRNESDENLPSRWTEASPTLSQSSPSRTTPVSSRLLKDHREWITAAPAENLFAMVQKIGGKVGWYYADWMWKLRGALDRAAGGVGMRRGRRHPVEIRVGDAIDFWRVEKYQAGAYLKLRAEMKLPGQAWLEFRVTGLESDKTLFQQTATFIPGGWLGILYWYAVLPAHLLVFRNMARNIVRAAEKTGKI